MARERNFFARAFDAVVTGREQKAQAYVARFDRQYAKMNETLTKR